MEQACESCVNLFPELNVLVSQLKCGICYEIMKTPMITTCGHSYCSICIRTWITTKQLCPTCQSEVRDESLRNNLAFENCIDPYISLQNKLHELCQSGAFQNFKLYAKTSHIAEPKCSVSRRRESNNQNEFKQTAVEKQSPKTPSSPEHNTKTEMHNNEPQNVNSPAKIPGMFSQSPQVIRSRTDIFTSPTSNSSSRVQNDSASSSTQSSNLSAFSSTLSNNLIKVACPVCTVEIPERNINVHLDKCLTMQDSTPTVSPRSPGVQRREPLKKLVYHVMSEKEIRKVLSNYCLSTKGDKSQLINRLQRYTVLYNSECDSLNPRPVADIRKQLEKDEEALTKVAPTTVKNVLTLKVAHQAKVFRVSRNADPAEIEEIHKQYREENKLAYDNLIQQVRDRDKKKEQGGLPRNSAIPNRTSVEISAPKSGDLYEIVSSETTSSKRKRSSDGDSDEFSNTNGVAKTPKSRRIKDSDDELFTPKMAKKSVETATQLESTNSKNSNGVLRRILPKPRKVSSSTSNSSSDVDLETLGDSPSSPVLSRMCSNDDVKTTNKRPQRRIAHREPKQVLSPEEVRRPSRRKASQTAAKAIESQRNLRRGRADTRAHKVRTVSRTPSLSPSRLRGLDGTNRESSETPEMQFEMRKRPLSDDKSDEDMDAGNDNLSQLVSIMDASRDSSEGTQEF